MLPTDLRRLGTVGSAGRTVTITQMHEHYAAEESRLRAAAGDDLGAYPLAARATGMLGEIVARTTVATAPEPAPPNWYRRAAIFNLCVVALRAARSCMTLVASGYEPEALGPKRTLMEAYALVQAICADRSGDRARKWLEGTGPKPRKVAGQYASLDLFDLYSQATHPDARGVGSWLAVPMPEVDEHHRGLIATPHRRPENANVLLVETANEVRDLAAVLHRATTGARLDGLDDLDAGLVAARKRWYAPESDDNE